MRFSLFLMHIFGQLTVPKSNPKQEYTASATKFMELIDPQFRLNDYSGRNAHQDVKVSDIICFVHSADDLPLSRMELFQDGMALTPAELRLSSTLDAFPILVPFILHSFTSRSFAPRRSIIKGNCSLDGGVVNAERLSRRYLCIY